MNILAQMTEALPRVAMFPLNGLNGPDGLADKLYHLEFQPARVQMESTIPL